MGPRALTRALGSIVLLGTIGSGLFMLSQPGEARGSGAERPSWIEYLSPLPGSERVLRGTNVIVRPRIGTAGVFPASIRVSTAGSLSGPHDGSLRLSDDGKTVTFRPDRPFEAGERVAVSIEAFSAVPVPSYAFEFRTAGPERDALRDLRVPESEEEATASEAMARRATGQAASGSPEAGSVSREAAPAGEPLPADFPAIHVGALGMSSPGKLFLSSFSQSDPKAASYLLMLENDGTPFFYRRFLARAHDFKLQPDGRLTYYDSAAEAFYALDSTFSVVDSFRCGNGYTTDFHECLVLPNGHALLLSFDPEIVDMTPYDPKGYTDATVIGLVIQEIDRQKDVVLQWRSWDHFEIMDAVGIALGGRVVNYVHGNSIDVDADGNLIVSARSMNRVTKISRSTGEIIWTFGGVKNEFRLLNDPTGFSRQHAVRWLPNGNLILFDNGNFRTPPYSRAVEYAMDETRRTARLVWQYRHDPDVFAPFAGYAQRLPTGNTVIGWGTTTPTVTEVTSGGEIVSELSFDPGIFSYRAYRFEWPPILFARIELYPKTLNTGITTGSVAATIEPVGFDPALINVASVTLAGVPAEQSGAALGDRNGDGLADLTLTFPRAELAPSLTPETTRLELKGMLTTGKPFHGFADVRVVSPNDGTRETLTIRSEPGHVPVRLTVGALAQGRGDARFVVIYDSGGRVVRRLKLDASGAAEWDGRGPDGRTAARGIYFARIEGVSGPGIGAPARKIILFR